MLAKDDWLYVTEGDAFDPKPILFNNKLKAEEFRSTWGTHEVSKVVEYENKKVND